MTGKDTDCTSKAIYDSSSLSLGSRYRFVTQVVESRLLTDEMGLRVPPNLPSNPRHWTNESKTRYGSLTQRDRDGSFKASDVSAILTGPTNMV